MASTTPAGGNGLGAIVGSRPTRIPAVVGVDTLRSMSTYAIRGGQAGFDRLQLLARERRADTVRLLRRAGVGPGQACLDLGCGGGPASFELARLVGGDGRVTGIDLDEVKLDLARRAAAEQGIDNVEFRAQDLASWAETDRYDVAYARNVLQHLAEPVDLLRRMWAALRPGGRLIVEDADFDGCFSEPANPGYELFRRVYPQLLARRGGDASIGRRLYGYFRQAGIGACELRVVNSVAAGGEEKYLRLSTLEATADAMLAEGLVTPAEIEAALVSLADFVADPATILGGPAIFQAWAVRPA
jgi:ubiquinone/menaquinone biosynthesis C-methylase UbiE